MTQLRAFSVLCVCAAGLQGCTVFQTMREGSRELVRSLTPESLDEDNPADDPGDPWIAAAAGEGRHDQRAETADDPLHLRQYFVSPKARSIENNVGIAEHQ